MKLRQIYATTYDYDRLNNLLRETVTSRKSHHHLEELRAELDRAKVVDSKEIPADVVTMNTKVRLKDLDGGGDDDLTYTLVFPADANLDEGRISVLAPIGTAILGYRAGATVEWKVPAGVRRLKIEEVLYQPEAAGDFHL